MRTPFLLVSVGLVAGTASAQLPSIAANDNRTAAGKLKNGVLTVHLEARQGLWHPEAETGVGIPVEAFAEAGHALQNPGPLLRVPQGTVIHATVANRVPGHRLVVHGLLTRPARGADSLVIAPGAIEEVRFVAGAPGTYFYWGTTTGSPLGKRRRADSQLSGAIVVDPPTGDPPDRVFVLGVFLDSVTVAGKRDKYEIPTINGKMFPHTNRFDFAVGDTVRWRWINASDREHPMHLHGFYYQVESHGDLTRDTIYEPVARRAVVTENLTSGSTMAVRWVAERPGNWIFHCHILFHVAGDAALSPPAGETRTGSMERMSGLVLALHVRPAPRSLATTADVATGGNPVKLRLLVQTKPNVYRDHPGYGFVLQEGATPPALDSIRIPGSRLVLTQGRPAAITVVNHLADRAAIHWHGIELPSFYDGVPGMSGDSGKIFPSIAPGDSFTAIFTPPRAGTFIYHTHIDDVGQMEGGLYGPLIVLPPGATYDSTTDHSVVISIHEYKDTTLVLLNGSTSPAPLVLRAGVANRIRIITIPSAGSGEVVLLADSTPVTWRAVAKDGADLPPVQATERPARQAVSVGETHDFVYTPPVPGELRLELRGGPVVYATLPIHVR